MRATSRAATSRFRVPSWWAKAMKYEDVTPDTMAAWKVESQECEDHNRQVRIELSAEHRALVSAAEALYGVGSAVAKYLKKQGTPVGPYFSFYDIERKVQDAQREKQKAERERESIDAKRKLTEEAVLWLMERGKKLGEDFTLDNALSTANEIAADEEIARRKAEPGPHSFCGDDNCEDCDGWDGESHRCDCGNRRVSWTVSDWHTFKEPYVYAEAY